jgi:hypothetical protein
MKFKVRTIYLKEGKTRTWMQTEGEREEAVSEDIFLNWFPELAATLDGGGYNGFFRMIRNFGVTKINLQTNMERLIQIQIEH